MPKNALKSLSSQLKVKQGTRFWEMHDKYHTFRYCIFFSPFMK